MGLYDGAEKDIQTVLKAVVENWEYEVSCSTGTDIYECQFCGENQHHWKNEHHKPDCPVLIAKDLLTGTQLSNNKESADE